MTDSQIEEIKNRLNIVEVIGSYIKLKKTGANYRAICPFHSEKTPSFFVSPVRQIWHCFGCGAGGSIFDFVKQIEGIEFGDALRFLAQKAGVELKRQDPKIRTERQRLYEILELACCFFEKQLEASNRGKEALKYLLSRKISKESVKKWRLGYAPNTWQGLSDFLVGKGYSREELEKAGLAVKSEKSDSYYDRFRGRIIFPVFDLNSQPIGFGARIFEKEEKGETAKYINTPQTILYDKSRILYGLNFAKLPIRKSNSCVITEGYTDVIMAHQAGFENTVAVSGTALTPFHLEILKRYTENLVLAFDMDIAGDTATKRGIEMAQEAGFNIKIIKKTEKDSDPADVISKNPLEWEKSLKEARSILDFYFDSAISKYNKDTVEGKKEIGKIILPVIKRIPNKIEQSFWIQKLATILKVREESVLEELKKTKTEPVFTVNKTGVSEDSQSALGGGGVVKEFLKPQDRKIILEEKIVSLLLRDPATLDLVDSQYLEFFSEKTKKLIETLKKENISNFLKTGEKDEAKKKINDFILNYAEKENSEEFKNFLAALSLRAEIEYDEDAEEEIQTCLSFLRSIEIKNKLKEISDELKLAEAENNSEKAKELIEKFNKLSREL